MRDFIFSAILLLAALPLMFCVALVSFFVFGKGIFFSSKRLGLGEREFTIFKFRTMHPWTQKQLDDFLDSHPEAKRQWLEKRKIYDDFRCPGWGNFLRRFSLDELPQLINVLRGEMSLVGPRPIVEEEKKNYGRYSTLLHSVKPGITGLWQVSGRNLTSYRRRVAINVYYIRHKSWKLDLWIIGRTLGAVFVGRGAF